IEVELAKAVEVVDTPAHNPTEGFFKKRKCVCENGPSTLYSHQLSGAKCNEGRPRVAAHDSSAPPGAAQRPATRLLRPRATTVPNQEDEYTCVRGFRWAAAPMLPLCSRS